MTDDKLSRLFRKELDTIFTRLIKILVTKKDIRELIDEIRECITLIRVYHRQLKEIKEDIEIINHRLEHLENPPFLN